MIQKLLAYYIVGINIFTFVMFWYDKHLAKVKKRRISERELHTLSVFGGFIGASFAMYILRHKTNKSSFLIKHIIILVLWIAAIVYYFTQVDTINFLR